MTGRATLQAAQPGLSQEGQVKDAAEHSKHQPRHYRLGVGLISAKHIVDAMAGKQKSTLAGWVHGWVGAWLRR